MNGWIWSLWQIVWGSTSPAMRDQIVKSIKEWEVKARETKGKGDDILVAIVKWLLAIQ